MAIATFLGSCAKVGSFFLIETLNYFLVFGIAVMISGFSAVAEAWVTPDLGRNASEILPHSTPFLNRRSESLDIPSAIDRGTGIQMKTK